MIAGKKNKKAATKIFLHILDFLGIAVDLDPLIQQQSTGKDFIILEAQDDQLLSYFPNITLITDYQIAIPDYLQTVISGGVVIYAQEDEELNKAVENCDIYFRKIPFDTADYIISQGHNFLQTDLGEIPVQISQEEITFINGIKVLAQQLGIMEEDFYEAVMNYHG